MVLGRHSVAVGLSDRRPEEGDERGDAQCSAEECSGDLQERGGARGGQLGGEEALLDAGEDRGAGLRFAKCVDERAEVRVDRLEIGVMLAHRLASFPSSPLITRRAE
ncbi:MAG: hypothetical protein AAGF12_39185 [Myxococcota bacterium]